MQLALVLFRPRACDPDNARKRGVTQRNENHSAADDFEYFHDGCVVWAFAMPQRGAVEGDCGELGHRFFEYCFQVPANRIGSYEFTPAQLKTIQEIITLSIFPVFSVFYLGDRFKWNYGVGFALIVAAAFFIFHKW